MGTKATFDDAMSLFAAGLMDQDCMEWVVSQEYAMNGESTHTLLLKLFSTRITPSLEKSMLKNFVKRSNIDSMWIYSKFCQ